MFSREAPSNETHVIEANDYDSPDDALAGAASRIGAEWYVRHGDKIDVFMRASDGYYKASLFKKGGWYHWPMDWADHVLNLPAGARALGQSQRRAAEEHSPPDASFIAAQRRLLEALRKRGWRVKGNEAEGERGEYERVRILPQLRYAVEIWRLVPSFSGYSSSYEWAAIHRPNIDIRKMDVDELIDAVKEAYAEDYRLTMATLREDDYQENPRGPKCGPGGEGKWIHRGGCCPGRPHCRMQRREEGLCHCEAYHYPHRRGSGRCVYGPEGAVRMDRWVHGPPPDEADEEEPKEIHKASFHLVFLPVNQAWAIFFGQGEPSTWSRIAGPAPYEEMKAKWDDMWSGSSPSGWGANEAREQAEPSGEAAAVPWVKLERDPEKYAEQVATAQSVGHIDSARAVYDMLSPSLAKEDQEVFLVVAVDIRRQCRGVTEVHRGARSRVSVDVPEILRVANALGGEMFIVVHNHPTSRATPSKADKALTKAIEKGAQATDQVMMDHIIIGMPPGGGVVGEYYSFADNALVKVSGRERRTKTKRSTPEAAEDDRPPIVVAPKGTPAWLTVGADDRTLLFHIWGMQLPAVEVDFPEDNENWGPHLHGMGWATIDWAKFRSEMLSSAPGNLSPQILYQQIKRGPKAKGIPPIDLYFAEGLKAVGLRHQGSPVWWTDLDHGPVAGASLYDLARFEQPYTIPRKELRGDVIEFTQDETDPEVIKAIRKKKMQFAGRPLWLLSQAQWDNQEFPAPSMGGPPYIPHVSVGHER